MTAVSEHTYLTTSEVARLFRVHNKTVVRWAQTGQLPHTRTLGGHRRFLRDDVMAAQHAAHQTHGADGAAAGPELTGA